MVKKKIPENKKNTASAGHSFFSILLHFLAGAFLALTLIFIYGIYRFESSYKNVIYPGVKIDGINFGGKDKPFTENYFLKKSTPLHNIRLILDYGINTATLSGEQLNISFDGKLAATQAFSIGRSGNIFSDMYLKWKAATIGVNLTSLLTYNTEIIDYALNAISENTDIPPQDALFQYENGKVLAFKPSMDGKSLNRKKAQDTIHSYIITLANDQPVTAMEYKITLPVEVVHPKITTSNSNSYGIKELLGTGTSKFAGSIPGRVHNVELAATRIHGHLIPPDAEFSFNDTLGDVSAATGFQQAYVIKDGRTVLGDGGGVCQVSTTLFRAILNAGLPVTERHAHSYRVGYYEQDSGPGLDATVYSPSYDLRFKNDTGHYILIQAKTDRDNYSLEFSLFGTSDSRKSEITKPVIMSQIAPPPDLYQDDPTLPKGTVKQVDWRAWGAKVSFNYRVTRNGNEIYKETYYSNYQPWKAIFLRGTRE